MESPHIWTNASPRSHSLSNKMPSARCERSPSKLIREFPETPKRIQAFAIALGYLKTLDKTLLLKTQHTLLIGHEKKQTGVSLEA